MRALLPLLVLLSMSCNHGPAPSSRTGEHSADPSSAAQVVRPPFAVRGDLSGLLLVWFDAEGAHTAARRDDIPAERREHVRIDSFDVPESQALDPDYVYVADVRAPGQGGDYVVRKVARDAFDALVARGRPAAAARVENADDAENAHPANAPAQGGKPRVIIYGASWCGPCHQAADFLRARNVPFELHDIEREPSAREEMQRKCAAAHRACSGIPVIDVNGRLLEGFSAQAIVSALGG